MSEHRMIRALGLLEQALIRAETSGAALEAATAAGAAARDTLRSELDRLEARHKRLRASAESAIARIDGLIAPFEGEETAGG